ncbi:MAG: hypothetical protein A3H97_18500 [Acidobacteria bacterium RIFCSPLOWO2_02_FULL_65_29]|nr:MAG: hypothetical protein A3H97_18500 [Acidobacteria bacterium RIFCSPLOWO2_02_FULL_65_29]
MTANEIAHVVVDALTGIAPEIDPAAVQSSINFREQFDLDSVDFLNFVLALHERLGIDIPEADYARLYSLESAVRYLTEKASAAKPSGSEI